MEVDGTVDSDWSFNKKSELSLIYDLQVLAWYFKRMPAHSDKFAETRLKLDTASLDDEIFSKHLCILASS